MPEIIKVVHVDDEQNNLYLFKKMLAHVPDATYMNGFTTAPEALTYLQEHKPDLLVLDVEMPGHNGLWLIEQLRGSIPVVFLTSHAGYAFEAFQAMALDFLLKPIELQQVLNLIQRFKKKVQPGHQVLLQSIAEMHKLIKGQPKAIERIFINTASKTIVVNLSSLMYIKASANYCYFTMADGSQHVASKNLKVYADILLEQPCFIRSHRSYIVNKNYISSILRKPNDSWLVMQDDSQLEISGKLKKDIQDLIKM